MMAVPSDCAPSENCTVPLALPPATRAVNVTAGPGSDGLLPQASSSDESARPPMEIAFSGDVLGAKSCALDGVNVALMRCDPAGRLVTKDAVPAELTVASPPSRGTPLS